MPKQRGRKPKAKAKSKADKNKKDEKAEEDELSMENEIDAEDKRLKQERVKDEMTEEAEERKRKGQRRKTRPAKDAKAVPGESSKAPEGAPKEGEAAHPTKRYKKGTNTNTAKDWTLEQNFFSTPCFTFVFWKCRFLPLKDSPPKEQAAEAEDC